MLWKGAVPELPADHLNKTYITLLSLLVSGSLLLLQIYSAAKLNSFAMPAEQKQLNIV